VGNKLTSQVIAALELAKAANDNVLRVTPKIENMAADMTICKDFFLLKKNKRTKNYQGEVKRNITPPCFQF